MFNKMNYLDTGRRWSIGESTALPHPLKFQIWLNSLPVGSNLQTSNLVLHEIQEDHRRDGYKNGKVHSKTCYEGCKGSEGVELLFF
jgi:hypothetical protein